MPPKNGEQQLLNTPQKSGNASTALRTTGSVEMKPKEHSPIRHKSKPATPLRIEKSTPPAQRSAHGNPPESRPGKLATTQATNAQRLFPERTTETGFLPYTPRVEDVAHLLSKHIADLRREPVVALLGVYNRLERGFHLVFKRELCLKHDDLNADDHKGKRPLREYGVMKGSYRLSRLQGMRSGFLHACSRKVVSKRSRQRSRQRKANMPRSRL